MTMSQLDLAESTENVVLAKAKAGLDKVLDLVEDLAQLYAGIQKQYVEQAKTNALTPEQSVLFQAVISCRHQLVLGILTLLRGHLGDSCGYLRKAQEYTIFAARVLEEANTAVKWLQAGNSEEAWEEYKKDFKIYYMTDPKARDKSWKNLAADLDRLVPIFGQYDTMSRRLHATVLAAGPFYETKNGETGLSFHDGPVDLQVLDDPKAFIKPFFFMLECHLDLIHAHACVLLKRSGLGFDEAVWKGVFQPIENKVSEARTLAEKEETTASARPQ